jgi:hypothetical protein
VLYAHKDDLVYVNAVEEDGKLETTFGKLPVVKGDFIITHLDGTTRIISQKELNESYVEVEKIKKKVDIEQMAENYAQDWSNFDDEEYIERFQETVRKRNELNNN